MLLANPIYDVVFKYLMEDMEIAKGLIAMILDTEIIEISVKPQETTTEIFLKNATPINIYRLDFLAVIKEKNGNQKKVLIELQKTKRSTNIMRFRRYLGENYQREDEITENGQVKKQPLEIITIYFLGFELEDVETSILKVKNCFVDVTTGNPLGKETQSKFIRLLNHESYVIQIPFLKANDKSRVERILNVFSQKYKTDDEHILNYKDEEEDATPPADPLLERILRRLIRAIADEKLRKRMDVEDEIETEMQDLESKLAESRAVIEQKDQQIEQKDQQIEQKDQQIEQNKQELEQKDQELAVLRKLLEELNKSKN